MYFIFTSKVFKKYFLISSRQEIAYSMQFLKVSTRWQQVIDFLQLFLRLEMERYFYAEF